MSISLYFLLALRLAFSAPLSDGAVIQSGKPIPVRGSAEPGRDGRVRAQYRYISYG